MSHYQNTRGLAAAGSGSGSEPPPSMICPITHALMKDPVMDSDGYSYERDAIIQWVRQQGSSPVTRKPLALTDLTPNRALLDAIDEFNATGRTPTAASQAMMRQQSDQPTGAVAASSTLRMETYVVDAPDVSTDALVHIRMVPPASLTGGQRPPADICLVIDTSGSMNAEAKLKTEDGQEEGDGLSMLDVVKHGVKTVMGVLQPTDRLAIVQYASRAKVVHRLRNMAADGKTASTELVDALKPSGTTNLWDGLKTGLEVLREDSEPSRTQSIFLLTDGVPNIEPPRGHIPMLNKYFKLYPAMRSCIVNTFGFGYSLNSELLQKLATEGQGSYGFIPDVGFVGTAFIHAISNTLAVCNKNLEIELIPAAGLTIGPDAVVGGHQLDASGMVTTVKLGAVSLGQSKDLVVRIPKAATQTGQGFVGVTARYVDACTGEPKDCDLVEIATVLGTPDSPADTLYNFYRLRMATCVRDASMQFGGLSANQLENLTTGSIAQQVGAIKALVAEVQGSPVAMTEKGGDMLKDLTGQVNEATSRIDWFKRWGRHYLPSLMFAHLKQQCNNFKDPGVQHYGGDLFESIRDEADDVFTALPPPVPTRILPQAAPTTGSSGSAPAAPPPRQPVQMARYHASSAPCFAGECIVQTPAGPRTVASLGRGDRVLTPAGTYVAVRCVVVSVCRTGKAFFVEFPGGLRITPYHPVRVGPSWHFPQDLHQVYEHACDQVYNFVLEGGHVMVINGVDCVTLGHGLLEPTVAHPYLGTDRVLDDLARCPGWDRGQVHLARMLRDPVTKLVDGLECVNTNDIVFGIGEASSTALTASVLG